MSCSPFWFAAARLSGRLDLRPLLGSLQRERAPSAARLAEAGVGPRLIAQLAAAPLFSGPPPDLVLPDSAYPDDLRQLPGAPPALWLRGSRDTLGEPAVAIVGSRRCTGQGKRHAARFARGVVSGGAVVVSGLAHGIDEAAHAACPARTIAVLGQGLDSPMTPRQARLAARIVEAGGLLLTEFPPGSPAGKHTFPQRNRVIAGLSRVTVVIEAARRSGALITARHALAAGREVLAVPGDPLAPASVGCLDLIADGAGLARTAADLLGPLGLEALPAAAAGVELPQALREALARGATTDELQRACGWPPAQLSRALTALQLTGGVQRLPGDRFIVRSEDPSAPSNR